MHDPHLLLEPLRRVAPSTSQPCVDCRPLRLFRPESPADQPDCQSLSLKTERFGLLTGSSVSSPLEIEVAEYAADWKIRLTGVPNFLRLSVGKKRLQDVELSVTELGQLSFSADRVGDLSGWANYHDLYAYRPVQIQYRLESQNGRAICCRDYCGAIESFVWQKL